MNGVAGPGVKVESVPSPQIKPDPEGGPSPYVDDDDVYEEDAGDLDFSQAQQQLWLSHIPRPLWETWSSLGEDEEIEIGTIRMEGPDTSAGRISLKLHNLPQFQLHPKEYILQPAKCENARVNSPGNAFIFSEKDLPGYKRKSFAMVDPDQDGVSSQGRSILYEKAKREARRKENKGRFEPYARRPIPKHTAINGVVIKEFECSPVKNAEYDAIRKLETQSLLRPVEKEVVSFTNLKPANYLQTQNMSLADKALINKKYQEKRTAAKESRTARMPRDQITDRILGLFMEHRIWGLRDLKSRINQPEAYVREVLSDIAFMWKNGDFNGKWELKPEYKERDAGFQNTTTVAPEVAESDGDTPGPQDYDDIESFDAKQE